jgi:hypothetical protein
LPDVLLLLAAAAASTAPGSGGAGLPFSPATEIASAVGDCWHAVGANGVDRKQLGTSGWSLVAGTESASIDQSPLLAFTKAGANGLVMLPRAPEGKSFCSVVARVTSLDEARATLDAIRSALQASDAKVRPARDGDSVFFVAEPKYALVDLTDAAGGTKEQPGMRIVVSYHPEPK